MKIVPQSKSLTTWPHDSAVNRQEIPQQQKKAIKNLQGRSSKPAKACARISILHTEKSGLTHKAKMRAQFRLLHLQIATLVNARGVVYQKSLVDAKKKLPALSITESFSARHQISHSSALSQWALLWAAKTLYASSHNRLQSAQDSLRQMDLQVHTMLTNTGALQLGMHAFCSHVYCSFACLKE